MDTNRRMSDLPHGYLETLAQLILVGSEKDTSNMIGRDQQRYKHLHKLSIGCFTVSALRIKLFYFKLYIFFYCFLTHFLA